MLPSFTTILDTTRELESLLSKIKDELSEVSGKLAKVLDEFR